jgi:purine-nucleoside phosphorylase
MIKTTLSTKIDQSLDYIRSHCDLTPSIAIILGSGLGNFADTLHSQIAIDTSQIPHYPPSTVEGHQGRLIFGYVKQVPILAVQGRTHYYEGHSISDVAYVVRLMARLGIKLLIVTNAAGGVNPRFKPGDLMIISDHINFMFRNPLRGPQLSGESRWADMNNAYDRKDTEIIEQAGKRTRIPLKKGVLFVSTGPTYETNSEVKMARHFGADAVSMSTIPEVLAARASQIKVIGISCITNLATGLSASPLSHNEVTEIAKSVNSKFQRLLTEIITILGKKLKT